MPTRRFFDQLILLGKLETTVNTDAAPTSASNGVLAQNVEIKPVQFGQQDERMLMTMRRGAQGSLRDLFWREISFDVEATPSGTAGTAPLYGFLFRACGMAQTSVMLPASQPAILYSGVDTDSSALTIWHWQDKVLHKTVGCRGTWKISYQKGKIPRFRFTFRGLATSETDNTSLTAPNFAAWQSPQICNDNNTAFQITIGATATQQPMYQTDFDFGNKLELYDPVGATEFIISERKATGQIAIEDGAVSDGAWDALAKDSTPIAIQLTHGFGSGKKVRHVSALSVLGERSVMKEKTFVGTRIPFESTIDPIAASATIDHALYYF